jgi:hypothetical protein
MNAYCSYGLSVRSAIALPELVQAEIGSAAADVVIRVGPVELDSPDGAGLVSGPSISADSMRFMCEGVGRFAINGGREIVVDQLPNADPRSIRFEIIGMAMAVLLHQRGMLVLHASVVAVAGGAVAFLGASGDGKSTTAACLIRRGNTLVCDDIAPVDFTSDDRPRVFPAYPEMRLWPETAESFGLDSSALPEVYDGTTKRVRRAAEGFATASLPLRRIYVLASGPRHAVVPLPPATAVAELLRHSYVANLLRQTGTAAAYFRQCARLAQAVPIARLERQRSLSLLDELAVVIEEDLAVSEPLATSTAAAAH